MIVCNHAYSVIIPINQCHRKCDIKLWCNPTSPSNLDAETYEWIPGKENHVFLIVKNFFFRLILCIIYSWCFFWVVTGHDTTKMHYSSIISPISIIDERNHFSIMKLFRSFRRYRIFIFRTRNILQYITIIEIFDLSKE